MCSGLAQAFVWMYSCIGTILLSIDWILGQCHRDLGILVVDALFTDPDHADDVVQFKE